MQRSNYVSSQVLINIHEELERIEKEGTEICKQHQEGKKSLQIRELIQPIKKLTYEN